MSLSGLSALLAAAALSAGAPSPAPACAEPAFADYPAPASAGRRARAASSLALDSGIARRYRAVLRDALAGPVNFAGRYVVAEWGCGAGCLGFAIVDKSTGHADIWPWPQGMVVVALATEADHVPLDYRPDSPLLVISGCLGDVECYPAKAYDEFKAAKDRSGPPLAEARKRFYLWTGKELRPIGQCPLEAP